MRTIGLGRCRLCTAHVHAAGEPSWTGQPLLRPRGVCVTRKGDAWQLGGACWLLNSVGLIGIKNAINNLSLRYTMICSGFVSNKRTKAVLLSLRGAQHLGRTRFQPLSKITQRLIVSTLALL